MYESVTHQVKVTVEPTFDPERSDPDERRYFWRYAVEIVNLGDKSVTLIERHWQITTPPAVTKRCADLALWASNRRSSQESRSNTFRAAR